MSPRWRRLPKNRAECPSGTGCWRSGAFVDPYVLDQYERAFQQQLEALIGRTKDPALRQAFEQMRYCPVQDRNGRCTRFVDYIVGALIRHGDYPAVRFEDALQRVDVLDALAGSANGACPRSRLFDFDESPPYDLPCWQSSPGDLSPSA